MTVLLPIHPHAAGASHCGQRMGRRLGGVVCVNSGLALFLLLAFYSVTRADTIVGSHTWDDPRLVNGDLAEVALFGTGSRKGSLIHSSSFDLLAANMTMATAAPQVTMPTTKPNSQYAGAFGACSLLDISSAGPESDWNKIYPAHALVRFLHIKGDSIFDAKVRLVVPPMRGNIRDYSQNSYTYKDGTIDKRSFEYTPDKSRFSENVKGQYLGKDRAIFEVEYKGKLYKVIYDLHVVSLVEKAYLDGSDKKCSFVDPVNSWRISGSDLNSSPTDENSLKAWFAAGDFFSILAATSDVTLAFNDLTGTAVGNSTSSTAAAVTPHHLLYFTELHPLVP